MKPIIYEAIMILSHLLVVVLPLASAASHGAGGGLPRKTDFISCDDSCNGGDVNYELTASVRTMKMLNYTYRGRTYSKEGSDSFMGPTMRVKPGQSIWIKLINNIYDAPGKTEVKVEDYWRMLQNPGEAIKYQYYKKPVSDPSLMKVDTPNIPKNFDSTNLHLHGLDIEVHMFDPGECLLIGFLRRSIVWLEPRRCMNFVRLTHSPSSLKNC